jgi:hypothetical protein
MTAIYYDNASVHNWLVREKGLESDYLQVYRPTASTVGAPLQASYTKGCPERSEVEIGEPMLFDYFGLQLEVTTWKPKS